MRLIALNFNKLAEGLSYCCGLMALLALTLMPILVAIQVIGRTFGFPATGIPEYTSYSMAALAFLGLSFTMKSFGHVRVSLLLETSASVRRFVEIFAHMVGTLLTGYATFITSRGVYFSHKYNDVSPGLDATPLWIPQLAMVVGFGCLFLLIFSRLLLLLFVHDVELATEKSVIEEEV